MKRISASFVMIAVVTMGAVGLAASSTQMINYQGRRFKEYRGMGSLKAMRKGAKDRYGQNSSGKLVAEGVEARVPFLDREFLDVAMGFDPGEKMIRDGRITAADLDGALAASRAAGKPADVAALKAIANATVIATPAPRSDSACPVNPYRTPSIR